VRVTRGEGVITDESGLMFKVIIAIKQFWRTRGGETKLAERGGGMCDTGDHIQGEKYGREGEGGDCHRERH
jgi:hypothetical protein